MLDVLWIVRIDQGADGRERVARADLSFIKRIAAGQPAFLPQLVASVPGARGIAIESGDFLLGFPRQRPGLFSEPTTLIPGVHPVHPGDLSMARQLVQSTPQWPPYTAAEVGQALGQHTKGQLGGAPFVLRPWQIDRRSRSRAAAR